MPTATVNGKAREVGVGSSVTDLLQELELDPRTVAVEYNRAILKRDARDCTGNFFIDEDVLRAEGVTDFEPYAVAPGAWAAWRRSLLDLIEAGHRTAPEQLGLGREALRVVRDTWRQVGGGDASATTATTAKRASSAHRNARR